MKSLLVLVVLLDVFPHCGPPRVVIREPGEDCGHHGPRWRGDCHEPATCFTTNTSGSRCTIPCTQDSDCTVLGQGFTCSASGSPYAANGETAERLCALETPP